MAFTMTYTAVEWLSHMSCVSWSLYSYWPLTGFLGCHQINSLLTGAALTL